MLVAGRLFNAFCGPVAMLLMMIDHEKKTLSVIVIVTIINFILNFFLIPIIGIIGSAISTSISMVIRNIVLLRFAKRNTGLNPSIINF